MTEKNFLGIAISGDVAGNRAKQTKQRPASDLLPAVRDVIDLAGDDFVGFKWTQYIPVFNDGDPCVFHTGEVYVNYTDIPGEDSENPEGENSDGWVDVSDQWVVGGAITVEEWQERPPGEVEKLTAEYVAKHHEQPSPYLYPTHHYVEIPAGVTIEKRSNADAVMVLAGLLNSGAFDHALQDAFGDNAEVTLSKSGFAVDYYDCGH